MTKLITAYPDYTISTTGIVTKTTTGNILAQWIGANGYIYVDLRKEGKGFKLSLHRLLALTFLPNPDNKHTVNHKDGNKLNNELTNLEWNTVAENTQHAYDTGLQPYKRKLSKSAYLHLLKGSFLQGHKSLTYIAKTLSIGLTQLSYHIKEAAVEANLLAEYLYELEYQKAERVKNTGKNQRRAITLQMLDKDTDKVLKTFNSLVEAQTYLGKRSSGPISNVLANRQQSAYGYKWKRV